MAVIAFQKPEKVVMQKTTEFEGVFEFSPLEKGYGVTIGNSLPLPSAFPFHVFLLTNFSNSSNYPKNILVLLQRPDLNK